MKNHRVVVPRHGPPSVLKLVEEEAPEPGPGEVRLQVLCAGVSAYDLMYRKSGIFPDTPKKPFTLGEDVVGVVDALADDVDSLEVGQVVAGTTFKLGVGGGYSELVCLPATGLVEVPHGVDPAVAVCVVVNYLTAYAAMHKSAAVRSGERALVHGAAGGVGSALLDLGRLAGLELFGTASAETHDFVRSFGAAPIDYRHEDFVERVQAWTPGGVDVVFDPIGGGRQLRRSYRALRDGGRLVWFGVAASKQRGLRVIPSTMVAWGLLNLFGRGRKKVVSVDFADDQDWMVSTLERLLAHVQAGELSPAVAKRVPLADAALAHELLERGGHGGKIVLVTEAGQAWSTSCSGNRNPGSVVRSPILGAQVQCQQDRSVA